MWSPSPFTKALPLSMSATSVLVAMSLAPLLTQAPLEELVLVEADMPIQLLKA